MKTTRFFFLLLSITILCGQSLKAAPLAPTEALTTSLLTGECSGFDPAPSKHLAAALVSDKSIDRMRLMMCPITLTHAGGGQSLWGEARGPQLSDVRPPARREVTLIAGSDYERQLNGNPSVTETGAPYLLTIFGRMEMADGEARGGLVADFRDGPRQEDGDGSGGYAFRRSFLVYDRGRPSEPPLVLHQHIRVVTSEAASKRPARP